jgi:hypothetical protein
VLDRMNTAVDDKVVQMRFHDLHEAEFKFQRSKLHGPAASFKELRVNTL